MNVSTWLIVPRRSKRLGRFFLSIILFFPIGIAPLLAWGQSGSDYKSELKNIAKEISAVSRNLNANKALLKTERDKLFESEKDLGNAEEALQATRNKLQAVNSQQQDLEKQLVTAIESQADNRKALTGLMRSRYIEGQPNPIKLLLNQENPYAVGRLNNYQKYFSDALQAKAEQVQQDIQKVTDLQQRKTELIQQLEAQKEAQIEQEARLKKAKQERANSVVKLNQKVEKSEDKLERLRKDRDRLNTLLSKIKAKALELERLEEKRLKEKQAQERSSSTTSTRRKKVSRPVVSGGFTKQKGRLSYPVDARRSVKYGARVAASGMVSEGVLFSTQGSVPVKSIFRGRVLFSDYLKGYGLLLIVDHGDDHISLYGHNASLLKSVGDAVETNEVISMSGVTGGLQSPGLYFEIRDNTTPVNPDKWCR